MYKSFIFIRHAQSIHNQMTKKVQANNPGHPDIKSLAEYTDQKYNRQLFDAPITQMGQYQCKNAAKTHGSTVLNTIDVVIVSPLKRALQTADILFSNNEKKVQIIVEPYLCQQMSSACDIGASIIQSKKKYQNMNFEKIMNNNESMWQMNYIITDRIKDKILQKIHKKTSLTIHEAILKTMEEQQIQTPQQFQMRSHYLRKQLQHYCQKYPNKNIAMVGHGGIFKAVTATSFNQDGTMVNSVTLDNAEIKSIPIILHPHKNAKNESVPLCGC